MGRPKTKVELIEAATVNYNKLMDLISNMSEKELSTPYDFSGDPKKTEAHWSRDKNLRDVIVHLNEWHRLLLDRYKNNKGGIRKPFLMEGYNWKTYGDMNMIFWKNCQKLSIEEALEQFKKSHQEIMEIIETISNEELFSKDTYDWVGGSTLGAYFISTTSSHYDWAMKKMKAHKKMLS